MMRAIRLITCIVLLGIFGLSYGQNPADCDEQNTEKTIDACLLKRSLEINIVVVMGRKAVLELGPKHFAGYYRQWFADVDRAVKSKCQIYRQLGAILDESEQGLRACMIKAKIVHAEELRDLYNLVKTAEE